ncbi:phenylacetate--CoA ligase family protein [Roseomonas eburnea]|uniref:Phenylacetate--CoA ligase family protein n=1 Tax=Neoroseomonas eburnea TaxID=1346889 RepID=A0A9X9XDV6_9PROT|nr:AMP-binding protein [Neoroseomonas eburnea]MBR0681892.1 phenylacetate--CoA ligase family protein [Neoroseomonas eburnea]
MDRCLPPLELASAVPGIAWPALPGPSGAALLAILFQLEQTQWWPAERLRLAQRRQLAALLAHARDHVPFWRGRLPQDWPDPADEAAWEATWQAVPILRREDIQAAEASEALLADALPPGHGEYREIFTSGSTGRPIRAVRSQLWELVWSAFTIRDHLWHRRDLAGTLAVIRESGAGKAMYPEGDTADGWGFSSAALFETGRLVSLNVTTPVAQQLDWLVRRDPDYLLSHPSILARLATASREAGLRLPRLRQVVAISETLRPEARAAIEAAWGVPVVDVYSSREAGYLALQCPDHPHFHIQSEGLRLEVVDEDGQPCAPGETGRVLVTPLHNLAMPLIRYDIGDAAEAGAPCPCGRGLPVLRRILGRRQNMLRLPNGERRWPLLSSSDIGALLAAAPPVLQHQVIQTAADRLHVRLAVARPLGPAEEEAVAAWARAKFGEAFAVAVQAMPELPRTAAGKFEDFVCQVAEDAEAGSGSGGLA